MRQLPVQGCLMYEASTLCCEQRARLAPSACALVTCTVGWLQEHREHSKLLLGTAACC